MTELVVCFADVEKFYKLCDPGECAPVSISSCSSPRVGDWERRSFPCFCCFVLFAQVLDWMLNLEKKIRSFSTLVLGLELGIIGDSVVLVNAALCCSCWILVREWSSGLQFPKENGEKILGVDWKLWWTSW